MEGIERQVLKRRKQTEIIRLNPMVKGATPSTYRAIADPYVV